MGIWLIWFIVAVGVIATKYYTARAVIEMNRKLAEREKHLSVTRIGGKVTKSNLDIAKRSLAAAQRKTAENKELIEKLKPELKELEDLEKHEMQLAKELIAMTKDPKGER